MATTYYPELQKLYVAYFNRPADPGGLEYWEGILEKNGGNTAVVSANFSTSKEYTDIYGSKSNEEIIDSIYQNLFGRSAEPTGKAYWAEQIKNKAFTISEAVKIIGDAALTTDATAYGNKVKAAAAFTAELDTPAEKAGYAGDAALVLAKNFLAGITTDASYAAAVTPTALGKVVSDVVKAGTPFTLVGALQTLAAANKAQADFLAAADDDNNATTSTTEAALKAKADTADLAVQTAGVAGYVGASAALKSALLTAAQQKNAETLTAARDALTAQNAEVAKIAGLSTAIANATSTEAALTAANKAGVVQDAALAAAVASYQTTHGVTLTVNDATGTVKNGTTDLIIINKTTGALVLADGIKETDTATAGITAVLNASIAETASDKVIANATAADYAADLQVKVLDASAGEKAALIAVGQAFTIVTKPAATDAPTAAQVSTEYLGLVQIKSAADAAYAADASAGNKTAADNAKAALDAFQAKLDDFLAVDTNSVSDLQATKAGDVTAAEKAITDLAKLVATATEQGADYAQAKALHDAVDAAKATFADNKLAAPVVLDGITAATAGSDVYLAGTKAATIISFGALGKDYLYVGKDFTLNTTGKLESGDDSKLEVFFVTKGTDTVVTLETKAFGSHSADAEIEITLTGVAASQLTLNADGIITLA